MKIRYPMLQLVKAHYSNKNESFDDYVKVIADMLGEDGDMQAKDELLKMMANHGEVKPLPEDYVGKGSDKYKFKNESKDENEDSHNTETIENPNSEVNIVDVGEVGKAQRHDGEAKAIPSVDDILVGTSHTCHEKNDKNDINIPGQVSLDDYIEDDTGNYTIPDVTAEIKPKRHRRTKAEMAAERNKEEVVIC